MSFKRISPTWRLRLLAGRKAGWGTLIVTATLAGTVITAITATDTTISARAIVLTFISCVGVALFVAWLRGHMKAIPDAFVDEINADGKYTCGFCSEEQLREACEMTKPYYGHEYVPPDVALQWRLRNRHGFIGIANDAGELCGCFGILALEKSFMSQFVAGRVSDIQMLGEDVLPITEAKSSTRLYVSGVVVRDPTSAIGSKRVRIMIWAILIYLKQVYGLRKHREIYAVGANEASTRLMQKLGFVLAQQASSRSDHCPLYRYQLTRNSWEQVLSRIGDLSRMCDYDFTV